MKDQASRNFISVVLLTFPSKIQYDLWYEKYITFYSPKAVEFLKANGQLRQSATLVEDSNDLIGFLLSGFTKINRLMIIVKSFTVSGLRLVETLLVKPLGTVARSYGVLIERFKEYFTGVKIMKHNLIIILLVILVLLQLVSIKYSHDNTYRLSNISNNTHETSSALAKIIQDGIAIIH